MRPVFVSVGHRIGLLPAARVVLACATRTRMPEPLRQATLRCQRLAHEAAAVAPSRAPRGPWRRG
jgi:deoxyribonuclease V